MFLRRFLRDEPAAAGDVAPTRDDARPAPDVGGGDTATVRRITQRLDAMPPDEARYLAGFAYVMSRAAQADLEISPAETRAMERFVVELGGIPEERAAIVVEMATLQATQHGATEDYLVTREFARRATLDQKLALLRCCFAVGAADETITAEESSVVNQIARELDVDREHLNAVRDEFHEHLSAIQAMRRLAAESGGG